MSELYNSVIAAMMFDGTKWHEFGDLSGLSSKDIGSMTNYEIAQTGAEISTSDTLNQAIGKVEKRISVNETNISFLNAQPKLYVDNSGYIAVDYGSEN